MSIQHQKFCLQKLKYMHRQCSRRPTDRSSERLCGVLRTTTVHNDTHPHEQLLQRYIGLGLGFCVVTARSELLKVLFSAPSVCGFCLCMTAWEPLNGFAPNSRGRRVWSLARMSLTVKVTRDKNSIFQPFWSPTWVLCLVKHL